MPVFTGINRDATFANPATPRSTAAEVFGAQFEESFQSGLLGSDYRRAEYQIAEEGIRGTDMERARFGIDRTQAPTSALLTQQDAMRVIQEAGLEQHLQVPPGGMREETVQILIRRKRAELQRQNIMSQSSGFVQGAVGLGGALAGALADPSNIALAYVPVIGPSRYAALLQRAGSPLGRAGVRAGVGAAEGVVGAAIVEPFNLYANQQQQADYDFNDALYSVATGAVFGAGLHAGAGFAGDLIRPTQWQRATNATTSPPPLSPENMVAAAQREAVLDRVRAGQPFTRQDADFAAQGLVVREIEQALMSRIGATTPARAQILADAGAKLDARIGVLTNEAAAGLADSGERLAALQKRLDAAETDDELLTIARDEGLIPEASDAATTLATRQRAVAELSALRESGKIPDEFRPLLEAKSREILPDTEVPTGKIAEAIANDPYIPIRQAIGPLPERTLATAMRAGIAQMIDGRPITAAETILADISPDPAVRAAAMDRIAQAGDEVDGANPQAAAWADTVAARGTKEPDITADVALAAQALDDARKQAQVRLRAMGLSDDEIAEATAEIAELEARARADAAGIDSAAMCMMRVG